MRRVLLAIAALLAIAVAWLYLAPNRQKVLQAGIDKAETVLGVDLGWNGSAKPRGAAAGKTEKTATPAAGAPASASANADANATEQTANLPHAIPGSRVEVVEGRPVVRLDRLTQERSGIQTKVLSTVTFNAEIAATGRVLDLQPLIAQRARYTDARYAGDVVQATLTAAKKEYERLSSLHRAQGDIATKRLQEAEAAVLRDQAEARRAEAEVNSVREEMRQQWGETLTNWALDRNSPEFAHLLDRSQVLLLVALRPGDTLPKDESRVQVAIGGDRSHAVDAEFISPAPSTDPLTQGETYFYRAPSGSFRSQMRVDVWIAREAAPTHGVIVPTSAVVWATGQAWAYVQTDSEHFVRRAVSTDESAPGGWFVRDGFAAGDRVVTAGAQMLFAEEFRWQLRNEDDND